MPPLGRFEQALLLQARVGEGAALVPEQLALQELLRERGARDVHERPGAPVAAVMDHFRDQVLASAALAGQQHRGRRAAGDTRDELSQMGHGGRCAHDAVKAVGARRARPELPHLATQPGRLECPFDGRRDLVEVERLVGEVIRPQLHRLDRGLDAGVRRQEDDQDVLIELLHLAENRDAVGIGEPVVEQDQVDPLRKLVQRAAPGVGLEHVIALRPQTLGEGPANQRFVIDDQDGGFAHNAIAGSGCLLCRNPGRLAAIAHSSRRGRDCASPCVCVGSRRLAGSSMAHGPGGLAPPAKGAGAAAPDASCKAPAARALGRSVAQPGSAGHQLAFGGRHPSGGGDRHIRIEGDRVDTLLRSATRRTPGSRMAPARKSPIVLPSLWAARMARAISQRTASSRSSNRCATVPESRSSPSVSCVRSFDPIEKPSNTLQELLRQNRIRRAPRTSRRLRVRLRPGAGRWRPSFPAPAGLPRPCGRTGS